MEVAGANGNVGFLSRNVVPYLCNFISFITNCSCWTRWRKQFLTMS